VEEEEDVIVFCSTAILERRSNWVIIGNEERSKAQMPNLSTRRKHSVRTWRGIINGDGFSSEFVDEEIDGDSNLFK
jgi:hypothetical protein